MIFQTCSVAIIPIFSLGPSVLGSLSMHQCVRRIIFFSFEFNQGCCLAISSSEGRNSEDVKEVINLEDGMPCSLALVHLYSELLVCIRVSDVLYSSVLD